MIDYPGFLASNVPEPPPGDTHQLTITTSVPSLILYCERMSEYDAHALQASLEQHLRSRNPVMSLPLSGGHRTRFNVHHALAWKVIPADPSESMP